MAAPVVPVSILLNSDDIVSPPVAPGSSAAMTPFWAMAGGTSAAIALLSIVYHPLSA
jgi:hypothetical protein